MTKLRRQSLVAYGAPLCETVIDCPRPQASEVMVRIERCGVCHSDLHVQDGYFKRSLPSNVTLQTSTYNAGPASVTALLAGSLDAAYLGP